MSSDSFVINVKGLKKSFVFAVNDKNRGWFSNLIKPNYKTVEAVSGISFEIKKGESVAFIGPNGAGKSTTIKMLSGIIFKSSGSLSVLGMDPEVDSKKLAYKIGAVFGQRSSLLMNLPPVDSLRFFGAMYDMKGSEIDERVRYLVNLFDLNEFLQIPVRKLSLGQRMRVEIACALVHSPSVLFLDEPTIGLDIVAKMTLRKLLIDLRKNDGVTIFLTSHDVGDIDAICDRTIMINHGKVMYDGSTKGLGSNLGLRKYIRIYLGERGEMMKNTVEGIALVSKEDISVVYSVDTSIIQISSAISCVFQDNDIVDIDVYEEPLEEVIRHMYEKN